MLSANKVKMSGSEKTKANVNTGNKIFGKHIRQFLREKIPPKRHCSRAKQRQRKTKGRAACANLFFFCFFC